MQETNDRDVIDGRPPTKQMRKEGLQNAGNMCMPKTRRRGLGLRTKASLDATNLGTSPRGEESYSVDERRNLFGKEPMHVSSAGEALC